MKTTIEQRFASIKDNGDLLRSISPDMDPEEAIARLKEYNRRDQSPEKIKRRMEHLRKAGIEDPETWEFYLNSTFSETQEDSLIFLHKHWPRDIESLLIPGQWSGGGGITETHTAVVDIIGFKGITKFSPEGHTIYLRIAPQRK